MALKFKFKTKDEIPAELQSLYVERDGAWTLDAEDPECFLRVHLRGCE